MNYETQEDWVLDWDNEKSNRSRKWHNPSGTRIYFTWRNMFSRCYNPKSNDYKRYGGRGIKVINTWLDYDVFFDWAMKSGYNDALTIERINNDYSYTPDNCTWLSMAQQAMNRRGSVKIPYNGGLISLKDVANISGVKYATVKKRHSKQGCKTYDELASKSLYRFANKHTLGKCRSCGKDKLGAVNSECAACRQSKYRAKKRASELCGTNLLTCLDHAYNEIKDRKGEMINGTFVKEMVV